MRTLAHHTRFLRLRSRDVFLLASGVNGKPRGTEDINGAQMENAGDGALYLAPGVQFSVGLALEASVLL